VGGKEVELVEMPSGSAALRPGALNYVSGGVKEVET
jgi:hypothetical protein